MKILRYTMLYYTINGYKILYLGQYTCYFLKFWNKYICKCIRVSTHLALNNKPMQYNKSYKICPNCMSYIYLSWYNNTEQWLTKEEIYTLYTCPYRIWDSFVPAKARPIYPIANTTTAYIYIVNDLTIIYMLDSPMTCTVCDLSFQKAPEFYKILFARQCEYMRAWWRHDSYTTWLQNVAKTNDFIYEKLLNDVSSYLQAPSLD